MAASVDNRQAFSHLPSSPLVHLSSQICQIVLDHSSSDDDDDDDDGRKDCWIKSLEAEPCARDPRDQGTADSWIPRSPSLIRLTGKHPFNAEPSLAHLMRHGFLTPTPIHYVRNHGAVPLADWSTWTVQVSGLVRRPAALTMDDLITRFPAVDIPVTLVCAGNRRKEHNMTRQTVGFNWGSAAVSTSVWRGALLCDVLRWCGVMRRGALNVCFEGAEDLPGGGGSRYGTSLRKEVAMDPSRDIMLAYMQNGEVLSPDHGFPVRMIIPGFIGGRMVKWLKRIIVTTQESDSFYHYKDNRVLPSHVDAELADAEGWWYKPEYIINELNINSVITTPDHDELLPINTMATQTPYTMRGYAYSGGGKKVTRVEITLDGGDTWRICSLDHPEKPNKYGKYWCWCFWSLPVELLHLLAAKEIAVRAWDETLNTQPDKLIWNVMGMMNNCWFRVRIAVCRSNGGEVCLAFHHPTQPGNQPGGWMNRPDSSAAAALPPPLKKSVSAPFMMNTSATHLSLSEVRKHASADSAWIVVRGHVYDCTVFLKDHPGGADSILINAGTDCTEEFDAIHSDKAKSMLDAYRIGELVPAGVDTSSSPPRLATIREDAALTNPREKVLVKLVGKTPISRNVRLFRFALPSANQVLGLPVGKHVFLCATIGNKLCMRAYTPTSPAEAVGYFELLIRVYFKEEHPKFPSGGLMSQHLESLQVGAAMGIKGPVGHIEYAGQGKFVIGGKPRSAKLLAMVAGGTGITPLYQVIQAVMREQPAEDCTKMQLVYASRSEEDILLREELDRWAMERPEQLKVWYVVSEVRRREEWRYSVGHVTEGILGEHIPMKSDQEETLALVCGPPEMIQKAVLPILEKMKYVVNDSCLLF